MNMVIKEKNCYGFFSDKKAYKRVLDCVHFYFYYFFVLCVSSQPEMWFSEHIMFSCGFEHKLFKVRVPSTPSNTFSVTVCTHTHHVMC